MKEGSYVNEKVRKKVLREELKNRNGGKNIITAKYVPKYPDSVEREYLRLVNEYMSIEREILLKHMPELKRIINEGSTQIHTDGKKENEEKRKLKRYELMDNTFVRLKLFFEAVRQEMDATFGLYKLDRMLEKIANLEHRLSVKEWKKLVKKTLGIDLLDDYYSGDIYRELLDKWVSDNVDLIKTVPRSSLGKIKELVYDNYMKGTTTTNIVKAIQMQYGMDKRHAKLIARDQTAKLNAAITQHQQTDVGIKRYKWDDSHDNRVRKSHRNLSGRTFYWNDPPVTDKGRRCHPGEDYQCRCVPLPIFDIDDLDLPM